MKQNSVFISGSAGFRNGNSLAMKIRTQKDLPQDVKAKLDEYIAAGKHILVGDCSGVDFAVQAYFYEKRYDNITIYHSGPDIRMRANNAWPDIRIDPPAGTRGRAFYTAKDIAMCGECEEGFAVWDGQSVGTQRNIESMLKSGKKVEIYRLDLHKFKPYETGGVVYD